MTNYLLTVAEYAERENISKQAVYQRLKNNKWKQAHTQVIKGRVLIDLNSFQNDIKEESTESNNSVNALLIEVEYLKKENDALHKQISEKDNQINSLIEGWTTAQRENSVLAHKVLLLESNVVTVEEPEKPDQVDQVTVEPENSNRERNIFRRLFWKK